MPSAVIFDLGGVVFPSPFEAFDAYERAAGLAGGSVRTVVRSSSESGAWAALERGELTLPAFAGALEAEARALGIALDARRLMAMIGARLAPRPEMVRAIGRIRAAGLRTAALTNNWRTESGDGRVPAGNALSGLTFDLVVESAVEGVRKPDPRIYALTLERLGVDAPEAVFLDDLGANLKPARELGMTTIKVSDPPTALRELSAVLGFEC